MNGIRALYKKRHERENYPLCLVRKTTICKLGSGFSPEGPCSYPDLRLPASTTVRSNACCLSRKPMAVDDSNLNSQHPRPPWPSPSPFLSTAMFMSCAFLGCLSFLMICFFDAFAFPFDDFIFSFLGNLMSMLGAFVFILFFMMPDKMPKKWWFRF